MRYSDFRIPTNFSLKYLYYSDGIGIIDINDKFYIDRKSFRNNLFMYVISGILYIDQKGLHQLKAGDLVVMRLSDAHRYYSSHTNSANILWMHFGDKNHPELLNYIEAEVGLPYIAKNEFVKEELEKCLTASKGNKINREYSYSRSIYNSLLILCEQINYDKIVNDTNPKAEFIMKVNRYIELNINNKPILNLMAKGCVFSKYHFCKLCKEYLGETPIRYYYKMKVERSKGRLLYGFEPISQIAISMGFCSQSHYSKVFKSLVGVCPNDYRKRGN